MKISIENLGPITSFELDIADFTLITGENNTGKTYIAYSLYGFLKLWNQNIGNFQFESELKELKKTGSTNIELKKYENRLLKKFKQLTESYSDNLHRIFSSSEDEFTEAKFITNLNGFKPKYQDKYETSVISGEQKILNISKAYRSNILKVVLLFQDESSYPPDIALRETLTRIVAEITLRKILPRVHVITSERTGINIFQNELDINKNVLFEKLLKSGKGSNFNPFDYLNDVLDRYSTPIKDGIDLMRDVENVMKRKSFIQEEHPDIIKQFESALGGIGYKNKKDQIYITYKQGRKKVLLPMHLASTSARSLFHFYMYIKHIASEGQLLIFDEPELNLHPKLQIQLTRTLAALSNAGLKILITTHSDYMVKEVNNLIMLSSDFDGKEIFLKKYKYCKNHFLKKNKVAAYIADNQNFSKIEIDDLGLQKTTFDETIEQINEVSELLYNNLDQ